MATQAAKNTVIYVNGYDFGPNLNEYEVSIDMANGDDTAFGDAFRTRVHTINDGSASLTGFFDVDAGTMDAVLGPIIGTGSDIVTVLPDGDANGNTGYSLLANMSQYTPLTGSIDGIVAANAEFGGREGVNRTTILHALGAETVNGSSTAIDFLASSTAGGVAYIHVTAGAGFGSVAFDVEDSADNSTFANLASFTSVTAANSFEKINFTGTVERYVRVSWTLTAVTSVTFWVGIQRF